MNSRLTGWLNQIMRMPDEPEEEVETIQPKLDSVQRKCAACAAEDEDEIQPKAADGGATEATEQTADGIHKLQGKGQPLPEQSRQFFEPRFGRDFSQVTIHNGSYANELASSVNAKAFTYGSHIVFGQGEFQPGTDAGKRLMGHELTHVIQQQGAGGQIQRMPMMPPPGLGDAVAQQTLDDGVAPNAVTCPPTPDCPEAFCKPYRSEKMAKYHRDTRGGMYLAAVSMAVDSRVVPLWREYINGGSSLKDLSGQFGNDFTESETTKKTSEALQQWLKSRLILTPPNIAEGTSVTVDLKSPDALGHIMGLIGNPSNIGMDYNIPGEVPGNIAGGVGRDQTTCMAGAQPSNQVDSRSGEGVAYMTRMGDDVHVTTEINYEVRDTIDLCPGNCGTGLEQMATVPFSQWEATGISGDVPFVVRFPGPTIDGFTVPAAK